MVGSVLPIAGALFCLAAVIPWAMVRVRENRLKSARNERWMELSVNVDVTDGLLLRKLGPYRTVERLGAGGMSTVCRAVMDETLDNKESVAVKIIHPSQSSGEFRARFEREIKVSMVLDHPNVLRVKDWGEDDGLIYLVMEVIAGDTLDKLIPQGGMALPDAMSLIAQLIEGLAYAHSLSIVHRDLKPLNVMVDAAGKLTLMDFGLARSAETSTVTRDGNIMGTVAYMAPEQITTNSCTADLTALSDQYSLAILIYQMLSGRRPFEEEHPWKMMMAQLQERAPGIRRFRPDLPPEVESALARMLAKEPASRFASVQEAGEALQNASMSTSSGKARRLTTLPPPMQG